jgi:cyclopropane fatty-acyl-phospholipid synthase-like methyltransferase
MRTCPWWITWTFDNPFRRLIHDPRKLLEPYVVPGSRVADVGCGMGYFTVAMAQLVGPAGEVQAVDVQPQQLRVAERRCRRANVAPRVRFVESSPGFLGLTGPIDFVLAFWMVHEVGDRAGFFEQLRAATEAGSRVLVAEPMFHVPREQVEAELALAAAHGFEGAMRDWMVSLSWAYELERM